MDTILSWYNAHEAAFWMMLFAIMALWVTWLQDQVRAARRERDHWKRLYMDIKVTWTTNDLSKVKNIADIRALMEMHPERFR